MPRTFQRKISRRALFARDGWRCVYCGTTGGRLTLDHVVPRSRGGDSVWENVVTSCAPCNLRKGNRLPHEVSMELPTRAEGAEPDALHPARGAVDPGRLAPVPAAVGRGVALHACSTIASSSVAARSASALAIDSTRKRRPRALNASRPETTLRPDWISVTAR